MLRSNMTADSTGGALDLKPHPSTAAGPVKELGVSVSRPTPSQLALDYRLVGDLTLLRLPEPRPPVRSDGLWRHTCFEAFIGHMPASHYWEYNFSPSSAWAAYHFTAYREGMAPLMKGAPPVTSSRIGRDVFEFSVLLDLAWLARAPDSVGLRLGISAVIEDRDRALSYWALEHPSEKPDFHHPGGLVVALD
jgi:hypothetical protein